jgi:hypothetical protein
VLGGRLIAGLPFVAMACAAAWGAEPVFRIPPVTTRVNIEGQAVEVKVSGEVFASAAADGEQSIRLSLTADLADFQRNLTPILAAQLNQSNRCGERLNVLNATLTPAAPAALLTVKAHVEKWGCAKAFGKEVVKRLVGGDGIIGVRLAPEVESGAGIKLAAEVTSIEADGSLGELMRSGSFGDAIREKVRASVVSAIQKSTDFKTTLPEAVREIVSIQDVKFAGVGDGALALAISSEVRVPAAQARELLERLNKRGR